MFSAFYLPHSLPSTTRRLVPQRVEEARWVEGQEKLKVRKLKKLITAPFLSRRFLPEAGLDGQRGEQLINEI